MTELSKGRRFLLFETGQVVEGIIKSTSSPSAAQQTYEQEDERTDQYYVERDEEQYDYDEEYDEQEEVLEKRQQQEAAEEAAYAETGRIADLVEQATAQGRTFIELRTVSPKARWHLKHNGYTITYRHTPGLPIRISWPEPEPVPEPEPTRPSSQMCQTREARSRMTLNLTSAEKTLLSTNGLPTTTCKALQSAFKRWALSNHPDKNKTPGQSELFKAISGIKSRRCD